MTNRFLNLPYKKKKAVLQQLRLKKTKSKKGKIDYAIYRDKPTLFSEKILHTIPTVQQSEIMNSVLNHERVLVKSANGVGKTFIAADVALWFLRCFPSCKIITTAAPPIGNLKKLLWGEIGQKVIKSPHFDDFTMNILDIKNDFNLNWWLTGTAIPKTGTEQEREAKFSGKHAPFLLFIVDEGDAVPDEVYRGIESCMSGGFARLLVLFNPRHRGGPIWQLIKGGVHVVELSAFDHPNVITGTSEIKGAVTREVTVRRILQWSDPCEVQDETIITGDSSYFQIPYFLDGCSSDDGETLIGGEWRKVCNPALSYMTLARFPSQSLEKLISREWIDSAVQRRQIWIKENGNKPPRGYCIQGQDVADQGGDKNTCIFRIGGWVSDLYTWNDIDILETAQKSAEYAKEFRAKISFIDGTGVGAGVAPGMRQWWRKKKFKGQAISVMVGGSPTATPEEGLFYKLRDQIIWKCAKWLRDDKSAMLPDDEELIQELLSYEWKTNDFGKIEVTNTKMVRKALGRSPDKASALFLTFSPNTSWGVL